MPATIENINIGLLLRAHENAVRAKPGYALGGKAGLGVAGLAVHANRLPAIDCSGYVRWLLYRGTRNQLVIPDGSWHQEQWCIAQGFKKTSYLLHAMLRDNRLRMAFIRGNDRRVGHVWLVYNGRTLESYSGNGPGSRSWLTPALKNRVTSCFVLTEPLQH